MIICGSCAGEDLPEKQLLKINSPRICNDRGERMNTWKGYYKSCLIDEFQEGPPSYEGGPSSLLNGDYFLSIQVFSVCQRMKPWLNLSFLTYFCTIMAAGVS